MTAHIIIINDQTTVTNDGIAFVDIQVVDNVTGDADVFSVYHAEIPRLVQQLVAQYGDLMKARIP